MNVHGRNESMGLGGRRRGSATIHRWLLFVAAIAILALAGPSSLPAQVDARALAEQQLGRSVTHAEIISRLRASGMSREEVRTRLQQMGYDPALADPYFDALESGAAPPEGAASESFVQQLQAIGVAVQSNVAGQPIQTPLPDSVAVDTVRASGGDSLRIFGRELFLRGTSQFEPVLTGPRR